MNDPDLDVPFRPVIVLVGHAGSGKSEIAVNLAFRMHRLGETVTLVDLDLVKPYFRCRMAREELAARGIRLVAPAGERFYSDLPMLIPEARTASRGAAPGRRVIIDVGGDRLGARALGSMGDVLEPSATDLLFVVNARRPFAEDLQALVRVLADVQAAARLPVTGLIANTHLMEETGPETVLEGIRAARELEAATGILLRCCAMLAHLAGTMAGTGGRADGVAVLPLTRHVLAPFLPPPGGARRSATVV